MKHFVVGVIVGLSVTAASALALTSGWPYSGAFAYRGSTGLTKREYAAIHAMQGLMARPDLHVRVSDMARLAWAAADALADTQMPPPKPRECKP
jgi:hypothetical protein